MGNLASMNLRHSLTGVVAALLISVASTAQATLLSSGVNLGAAGETKEWSVLSIGAFTDIDANTGATIFGDVGVAGAKRTFKLTNSSMTGNVYLRTQGAFIPTGSTFVGTVQQNPASNSLLIQAGNDALTASSQAFNKPVTPDFSSITSINTNSSFTLATTGDSVLRLSDFKLTGGAIMTLQGTAASSFIFNVTKDFSITNAQIVLQGGLLADNVLFNIVGKGSRSKATQMQIQSSAVNGIFLAREQDITVVNSSVTGSVIGGNNLIKITNSVISH
jgi:hypothetical protein